MSEVYLLTGSYSGADEDGIGLWLLDESTGELNRKRGVGGIQNPSFLAVHPNGRNFVAASEDWDGELVAFRFDPESGRLIELNRRRTGSGHPAHVAIDETGKWLLSAHYTGGAVFVHPLDPKGRIGDTAYSVKYAGAGPDAERQDAAHPHSVVQIPGTELFLVSDLGTDRLSVYRLNGETGELQLRGETAADPGSGPRHAAFHPSRALIYSLGELSSTITGFAVQKDGILAKRFSMGLLPADFSGENTAAEVAVSRDGRKLYASNRGHDSIAVFDLNDEGLPVNPRFLHAGGSGPRHFTLTPSGRWLVVANEQSDALTVMEVGYGETPAVLHTTIPAKSPV